MFATKRKGLGPSSRSGTYALVFVETVLRVFALYSAVHILAVSHLPVTIFTWLVLGIASLLALSMERMWKKKPLVFKRRQIVSIASGGAVTAVSLFGFLYLLRVLGPIRSLLVQHCETVFTGLLGLAMGRKLATGKGRGVALALAGLVLMLWFSRSAVPDMLDPSLVVVDAPTGMAGNDAASLSSVGHVNSGMRLLLSAEATEDELPSGLEAPPAGGAATADGEEDVTDLLGEDDATVEPEAAAEAVGADEEVGGAAEPLAGDAPTRPSGVVPPTGHVVQEPPHKLPPLPVNPSSIHSPDDADADDHTPNDADVDAQGVHHHIKKLGKVVYDKAHLLKRSLDAQDDSSVMLAGLWLSLIVVVSSSWRKFSKKTIDELGGRKRFAALSLPLATLTLTPLALYQFFWNWMSTTSAYSVLSPSILWSAVVVATFVVVLPEYLHGVISTKVPSHATATISFLVASAFTFLSAGDRQLTWTLFPAGFAIIGATRYLRASVPQGTRASMWDLMLGFGDRGVFHEDEELGAHATIGSTHSSGNTKSRVPWSVSVRKMFRHVMEDNDSRKIFIFLSINVAFMFIEILVGFLTNSLGLISDAGHMAFDNASLLIGLYASYMSKWRRDEEYTYGRSRYEVVGGFVNGIFLICIAVAIVLEGLERLWEPPEVNSDNLLLVSILGLLVNLVGLVFFHDFSHGGGGHSHDCGHSHGSENMQGVFLHVLADTLGSVGVIISTLMIQYWGWYMADPIASLIISILILLSVIPLLSATSNILLSRVPAGLEVTLKGCLVQIARFPGVTKVTKPHFWKLQGDTLVGTLHVVVSDGEDEQVMRKKIVSMLNYCGVSQVTVQIEKAAFLTAVAATGASGMGLGGKHARILDSSQLHFTAESTMPAGAITAGHEAHGHSHGGAACGGHGHGHGQDHSSGGHSQGGGHGHAHGGSHDSSHGDEHGSGHGHGHSHGGHGHSHGGGASSTQNPASTTAAAAAAAGGGGGGGGGGGFGAPLASVVMTPPRPTVTAASPGRSTAPVAVTPPMPSDASGGAVAAATAAPAAVVTTTTTAAAGTTMTAAVSASSAAAAAALQPAGLPPAEHHGHGHGHHGHGHSH